MYSRLPVAVRFVINILIILIFLALLAIAGIAIYGAIFNMDFPTAWDKVMYLISSAVSKK